MEQVFKRNDFVRPSDGMAKGLLGIVDSWSKDSSEVYSPDGNYIAVILGCDYRLIRMIFEIRSLILVE